MAYADKYGKLHTRFNLNDLDDANTLIAISNGVFTTISPPVYTYQDGLEPDPETVPWSPVSNPNNSLIVWSKTQNNFISILTPNYFVDSENNLQELNDPGTVNDYVLTFVANTTSQFLTWKEGTFGKIANGHSVIAEYILKNERDDPYEDDYVGFYTPSEDASHISITLIGGGGMGGSPTTTTSENGGNYQISVGQGGGSGGVLNVELIDLNSTTLTTQIDGFTFKYQIGRGGSLSSNNLSLYSGDVVGDGGRTKFGITDAFTTSQEDGDFSVSGGKMGDIVTVDYNSTTFPNQGAEIAFSDPDSGLGGNTYVQAFPETYSSSRGYKGQRGKNGFIYVDPQNNPKWAGGIVGPIGDYDEWLRSIIARGGEGGDTSLGFGWGGSEGSIHEITSTSSDNSLHGKMGNGDGSGGGGGALYMLSTSHPSGGLISGAVEGGKGQPGCIIIREYAKVGGTGKRGIKGDRGEPGKFASLWYNDSPPSNSIVYPFWMNTNTGDLAIHYPDPELSEGVVQSWLTINSSWIEEYNRPAYRVETATDSNSQNFTSRNYFKDYQTAYNIGNYFDGGSQTFTAPYKGLYAFEINQTVSGISDGKIITVYPVINGVVINVGASSTESHSTGNLTISHRYSCILNSNDTFRWEWYSNDGEFTFKQFGGHSGFLMQRLL